MNTRDHGGGLDAASARFGGARSDWLDLSTGINPVPFPVGELPADAWTALPDAAAMSRLLAAARAFWNVPDEAAIVAAPGASALIARLPQVLPQAATAKARQTYIPAPTYNEWAAAFSQDLSDDPDAERHVYVHPNNPDGRLIGDAQIGGRAVTVIDESFCDICPEHSHIGRAAEDGVIIIKSFGKFWGLAGLRLGFAIARPEMLGVRTGEASSHDLSAMLGPWSVAGPALEIGARALEDQGWAADTRRRLAQDASRLDAVMGLPRVGGTDLFRLYDAGDAVALQTRLARHHIWTRIFPYSDNWIRLGLPGRGADWDRLAQALA